MLAPVLSSIWPLIDVGTTYGDGDGAGSVELYGRYETSFLEFSASHMLVRSLTVSGSAALKLAVVRNVANLGSLLLMYRIGRVFFGQANLGQGRVVELTTYVILVGHQFAPHTSNDSLLLFLTLLAFYILQGGSYGR